MENRLCVTPYCRRDSFRSQLTAMLQRPGDDTRLRSQTDQAGAFPKALATSEARDRREDHVDSIETFQDAGLIRITKPVALPVPLIAALIDEHWALLEAAGVKGRRVVGEVDRVGYDISALQPYVEGPVLQVSGPDRGADGATFLLFMHPMNKPRTAESPFQDQVVDSGLHFHFGSRNLTAYINTGALIAIPCLTLPRFAYMEEGSNYVVRQARWSLPSGQQRGIIEVVLLGGQVLEVEFGSQVAHSFNAVGNRCLIVSRHPNEALELAKARERSGFREIGDGSMFLFQPRRIMQDDLDFYANLLARGDVNAVL